MTALARLERFGENDPFFKNVDDRAELFTSVIQVRMVQELVVKIRCPIEVLITRRQSTFIFLQIQAEVGLRRLVLAGTGWYWMLRPASAWIYKKKIKCFVFWLSGPHGTSNFDHQSLIGSDLNYTNPEPFKGVFSKSSGKTLLHQIFVFRDNDHRSSA